MSGDAAFRSINTDVKYSLPKSWEYRRSCAQLNRRFSLPRTRSRSLVRFAPYTLNFKFRLFLVSGKKQIFNLDSAKKIFQGSMIFQDHCYQCYG